MSGLLVLTIAPAFSQTTPNYTTIITLAKLLAAGVPVPNARICASPADRYGNSISISAPTWGLLLPNHPLCATVTSGALPSGGLPVPDAGHTNAPASINYNITVQVLSTAGQPLGAPIVYSAVPNITGASYAFDAYTPAANVSVPLSNTVGSGPGVPSSCTSPSLWLASDTRFGYICHNGVYFPLNGTNGTVGAVGPVGPSAAGLSTNTVASSASIATNANPQLYRCNGAQGSTITVTLPASPSTGQVVYVKNVGVGSVVIQGGSILIDGQSVFTLPASSSQAAVTLAFDVSTNSWNVI